MTMNSSVPAVMDAVVALFTTAATGSNVQVVDGELGTYVADQFLQVVDAQFTQVSATVDGSRRDETVQVSCMARDYRGNDDQSGSRVAVFALLALVETALKNDPTLGGASNVRAQMHAGQCRGGVTEQGGRATEVDFTISVMSQLINH